MRNSADRRMFWGTRLTTLAFPFAGGVFVDDPATGPSVRFYRLVQEPR